MERYSTELTDILQTKIGYRTEDYSGSGVRDAKEVIRFEIEELGNNDIPEFCQQQYNIPFTEDTFESWLEPSEDWLESLLVFLRAKLNTDTVSVLWLTKKENIDFYCTEEGENLILAYCLPETMLPISDLGSQGALFALGVHPDFMDPQIEFVNTKK